MMSGYETRVMSDYETAEDPRANALRSLAESRGLELRHVLDLADAYRLIEVVRAPVVASPSLPVIVA